jgi:hypothetical protein
MGENSMIDGQSLKFVKLLNQLETHGASDSSVPVIN